MYEKDFPDDFPKKSDKRSRRRSKITYIKKKAKRIAKNIFRITDKVWLQNYIVRHKDNTSIGCNCWMCKNPRKLGQKTFQELKQKESEKYDT